MAYRFADDPPPAPASGGRYRFAEDEPVRSKGPQTRPTNPNRGKSALELGLRGAGKFAKDVGLGAAQIATDVQGMLGNPDAPAEANRLEGMADARKLDPVMRTTAGKVGYTGAALVPAVGSMFVPGANTVTGAAVAGGVMGALQPTGTNDSRLVNTTIGAGAGAAGQGAFNALGRIAQPFRSVPKPAAARAIATLEREGVALDAAQRSASPVAARIKSALSDNPLTLGGQVQAAEAQKAQFNRAVLSKFGASGELADEATMGAAYGRIGKVFEDVLSRTETKLTPADLTKARVLSAKSKRVLGDDGRIPQVISDVTDHMKSNGGKIDGKFYQSVRHDLAALEKQQDIGPIAREMRESLDDAFQRSAKGNDGPALQEARRQWRNMRIAENAIDESGNISPAKLANQFGQKKNRSVGVYGKGDKSVLELARLAKAGKQVIPDKLPNSGTAARGMMQVAAPAAVGGAYGAYKEGDLSGIGTYALAGAALPFALQKGLNSPAATRYLTQGITTPMLRNSLMAPSRAGLGILPPAFLLSQQ
jgi:hypothetical protein